jgi:serine/threonine-protein kinase
MIGMIGQRVGNYRIEAPLGEGGIGAVFRAVDTLLDRPVAIKVLRPELGHDTHFLERFRAEAASLARLNHPSITTLYTLHVEAGQLMMIIELIDGQTIEDLLATTGPVSADECRALAAQATDGFAYAHRMGIVHRDIKPANLMITPDGALKIMDFGIARIRGSQRMTRTGHIIGTLAYMAPEQILGQEGDQRSDVYSLGVVLYELLAGAPPFVADSDYRLIRAQMEEMPTRLLSRLPAIDPAIDQAVMQALAKTPDDRPSDMAAFASALGAQMNPRDARAMLAARLGATVDRLAATREVPAIDLAAYGLAPPGSSRPLRGAATDPEPPATRLAADLADAAAPPAMVLPPVLPAAVVPPPPLTGKRRLPMPALLLALAAVAVAGFVGFILLRTPPLPPPLAAPDGVPPIAATPAAVPPPPPVTHEVPLEAPPTVPSAPPAFAAEDAEPLGPAPDPLALPAAAAAGAAVGRLAPASPPSGRPAEDAAGAQTEPSAEARTTRSKDKAARSSTTKRQRTAARDRAPSTPSRPSGSGDGEGWRIIR